MNTQLEKIFKRQQEIDSKIIEIEQLFKTLKIAFDISCEGNQNCDYLYSIIRILRKETVSLRNKSEAILDKFINYQISFKKE